jgi:hypothetical protein
MSFADRITDLDGDTESRAEEFRSQADRCRRLASGIDDKRVSEALFNLAGEYEARATELAREARSWVS